MGMRKSKKNGAASHQLRAGTAACESGGKFPAFLQFPGKSVY